MENEDKTERIDRYLDDMLTPEEKIAFEAEMAANPDFRFEMEAQEAVTKPHQQPGRKRRPPPNVHNISS